MKDEGVRMNQSTLGTGPQDDPVPCACMQQGKDLCDCDVPFIGNDAEAARRVKAGTLEALWDETGTKFIVTPKAISVALRAQMDLTPTLS
jgi:hypothetical protein